MKSSLHIIESNSLYGLSDSYEYEIAECIYDRIKSLKNEKYIVVKDKKAGILDGNGKIVPGCDEQATITIANIYKSIPRLKVETFTSIKVAEAAKLMENTQRDILIALPNEYLDFCTQISIDINDVIAEATQNGISHKSILDLSEDIVLV